MSAQQPTQYAPLGESRPPSLGKGIVCAFAAVFAVVAVIAVVSNNGASSSAPSGVSTPPKSTQLSATPPTFLSALSDFGQACTSGSQCASGICGSSCSSYDFNASTSQSCICPESSSAPPSYTEYPDENGNNGSDEIDGEPVYYTKSSAEDCQNLCTNDDACECVVYKASTQQCWKRSNCAVRHFTTSSGRNTYVKGPGNVCCGCVMPYDTSVQSCVQPVPNFAGVNAVSTGGVAGSTGVSPVQTTTLPDTPAFAYANQEIDGTTVDDEYSADNTEVYVLGAPPAGATLEFGAPCDSADECMTGICGTGCDCDSSIEAICSCEAPCNFPYKCCGGCIIGSSTEIQNCPAGINVTTFSGPSYMAGPY